MPFIFGLSAFAGAFVTLYLGVTQHVEVLRHGAFITALAHFALSGAVGLVAHQLAREWERR